MDWKQFKEKRLRTEDGEHIYLDVRPFGKQEGDAIEFCLRETLERERHISTPAPKKIVLICEPTSKIPSLANLWLTRLKKDGVSAEIRPQHRETTE
jgi:hypothetical protein